MKSGQGHGQGHRQGGEKGANMCEPMERFPIGFSRVFLALMLASFFAASCSSDRPEFKLSVTVDFYGDGGKGLYTHDTLDLMMREVRSLGVSRVYWQYLGDLEQEKYGAGTNLLLSRWAEFGPRTLAAIGEPLEAAVKAAHRNGLEIFGVLKPYHTGMSATFPEGSPDADPETEMRRIGGTVQSFNPFMGRFPHTRIKRRPQRTGKPAIVADSPDPTDQEERLPYPHPAAKPGNLDQPRQLSLSTPSRRVHTRGSGEAGTEGGPGLLRKPGHPKR